MTNTPDKSKLLPCPFCGGDAERITIGEDEPNNAGGDVITCTRCQASSHVEFGRKENLVARWNSRASSRPAPDMVEWDVYGETVLGMRVAAYRETHPEHGNKFGHIYSEHWSTPNYRHPNVKVERLFTEKQVRDLIQQQLATIERLSAALERAEIAMTCGREDSACYCPNCDNSFYEPREEIRTALGKDAK